MADAGLDALSNLHGIYKAWNEEGLGWVPGLDETNWPDAWSDIGEALHQALRDRK